MKPRSVYSCLECGSQLPKWMGKCPNCAAWNSLVEESKVTQRFPPGLGGNSLTWETLDCPERQSNITQTRLKSGISELDRVLGGGLVPDSFVLLGGDPGIGKSTLLLQAAQGYCENQEDLRVLYVSGEESVEQLRNRALRIGICEKKRLFFAAQTQLESVLQLSEELKIHVLLLDSLQTFSTSYLESPPGSMGQVRDITLRLMKFAKTSKLSIWIIGHVTKEGNIAGPKTIEHMVDTVLYFESEAVQTYRLLRAVKNRYGSSRELGVFEIDGQGLRGVKNPSSLFLTERKMPTIGTSIASTLEGTRPLLVELQALVTTSTLAMPRRTTVGMDHSRLSLIAAVLEKHLHLNLGQQDLFFNVAGGLRLNDPACDLAVAAAVWSSHFEKPLPLDWIFCGEVGLTGEIRKVSHLEVRIEEACNLGLQGAVIPQAQTEFCKNKYDSFSLFPLSHIGAFARIIR